MCSAPFTNIDIMENGDVYTCCSGYLKQGFSIGNVYSTNLDEIWNSENAKKLRYSVTEGDFEYCTSRCKWLNFNNRINSSYIENLSIRARDSYNPIVAKDSKKYCFENYHACHIDTPIENITLSCDASCNLHCSSCRSHSKMNSMQENNKLQNMLEKIIYPALKKCTELNCLASGEFFASKPLQEFCKTLSKQEFPKLKIHINTNAQLLTKEKWNEFLNLRGMWGRIGVSIDAAEKDTYESIRKGGKWDRLQDALFFISDLRKNNEIELFKMNFVIQKENYGEIPKFMTIAKNFMVDIVDFQRLGNWGTFSDEEFFEMDVLNPKHKNYGEVKVSIEKAMMEKGISVIQNVL
jgi:radical SAM protein with 4Fe4S-binding SPASM domain